MPGPLRRNMGRRIGAILASAALAAGVVELADRALRDRSSGGDGVYRHLWNRTAVTPRARAVAPAKRSRPLERVWAVSRPTGASTALVGLSDLQAEQGAPRAGDQRAAREAGRRGSLSAEALALRSAHVSYEASRRLGMMAAKYSLTEDQKVLIFPVLARASPAYVATMPIENESLSDAYLLARRNSQPRATEAPGATRPVEATDEVTPAAPTLDQAEVRDVPQAPEGVDEIAFEAALRASQDAVEAQLAPFLDGAQRALMDEEELDRYYWWGEILLQLAGEADASAAVSTDPAAPATPGAADADSQVPEGGGGAGVPAAHQGGNLLDLLIGPP